MKLLFDANISRRIVPMLADVFPESSHISSVGLSGETPDKTIWEFAKRERFSIVTADADFIGLAERHGSPPQIIRLERMNYSTQVAAAVIRRYAVAITEFEKSARSILILEETDQYLSCPPLLHLSSTNSGTTATSSAMTASPTAIT